MKKTLITISLGLALSACGGGGSSSTKAPTTPITPPVNSTSAEVVQAEQTVALGQSTELVLLAPGSTISDIQWQQTAGDTLEVYATTSKVIGFTPTVAGDYSFEITFNENGQQQSLTKEFTVTSDVAALTARLGHAVVEGNSVSLISYAPQLIDLTEQEQASLSWTKTQGPDVEFTAESTDGKVAVFFDAPNVSEDTLLTFTVSGTLNGESVSDDISILVESSTTVLGERNYVPFDERIADVFLYNENSPAGQKLIDCVYSNKATYSNSCNFNQTPLIAHISETPTVDEIMDRVVVSHQWMGDQFKKFLEQYDEHDDFKNLLRATTAVVLSYDIRPSFYHPYTGAIYLDPSDLWETPTQRDTINQAPDFRAGFGSELQFEIPWRYVKDNEYASYYYPLRFRSTRSMKNAEYDFASLLYHELAHANDYFPSTSWDELNESNTTFLTLVNRLFTDQEIQSDDLQRALPLDQGWATGGQNEMTKLGQVRFQDPTLITEQQKAYTMEDVANLFKTEGAPQFYSYSSTREDYAILFDGFMMKVRYGVDRDVAVSDQDYDDIVWGQRGREGETQIKPRVQFVTERIIPEFATEAADFLANMPAATPLDPSKSWSENINISEGATINAHSLAGQLATKAKQIDTRLIPKDGEKRHGKGRKFVY
ncbi:hypothetical protein [Thalassotalea sp. PP2-459]|uniref:hypothetical protein n=1 Tax=Thalassotalea sp. PP2-459 TaxID=1742724 RepID=UPI0009431262|nr:hypothetical protein [Thalassotalea sp. PP2-459]OKY27108.1 hypothetical protein BI291_10175 [Thalassotalea sp. PP2-459]